MQLAIACVYLRLLAFSGVKIVRFPSVLAVYRTLRRPAAPAHNGGWDRLDRLDRLDRWDGWEGLPPAQRDGGSPAKAGATCPAGVFHKGIIPYKNGKASKKLKNMLRGTPPRGAAGRGQS